MTQILFTYVIYAWNQKVQKQNFGKQKRVDQLGGTTTTIMVSNVVSNIVP